MSEPDLHNLPRLDRCQYQAFAAVHWTMKVEPAIAGWLNEKFHCEFRELLLHACARERLFCPVYCLMPDHLHLMIIGLSLESDQLNATKFLRTHLNRMLAGDSLVNRGLTMVPTARPATQPGWELQPQAHDHVLREKERKQNSFARVCFYILANPVRARLAKREQDWLFSGAVLPGYPNLQPLREDFWDLFWKLYAKQREATPLDSSKL